MKHLVIRVFILSILIFNNGCKEESVSEGTVTPKEPVVSILFPATSEVNGDSITVQISATDDKGIIKVEIYIDNSVPSNGVLLLAPYNYLWNVDSLQDNSTHLLYAKAYDADGNVSSTPVKNLRINRLSISNLSASLLDDSTARLSWTDNSRIETAFEIEKSINNGPYTVVKSVEPNITTVDIASDYLVGDSIRFRVRAISNTILGKYSNIAATSLVFNPPTNLQVQLLASNSITVSWKDNSSIERGFDIYQGTDSVNMILVKSEPINSISSTIQYLYDTTKYYYLKVQAVTSRNKSKFSNLAYFGFKDSGQYSTRNIKSLPLYFSFSLKDSTSKNGDWDICFTVDPTMVPLLKLNRTRNILGNYVDGVSFIHLDPYLVSNLQSDPTDTTYIFGDKIFKYQGAPTHRLEPYVDRSFVIQLANNRRIKMRMDSYYNSNGSSGFVKFTYVVN